METVYHFSVVIIAIIIFFMKVTAPNAFGQLILRLLAKVVPLFCMLYAGIEIFKYFKIIH